MPSHVAISRVHFPVTALGPGRRVGIWFQGCGIRCPGCISADTWNRGEERILVADLLEAIASEHGAAEGVTITGGEPFEQVEALGELLVGLRNRLPPSVDVLVYSGYSWERISKILESWNGLVDAVISEPFEHGVPQTRALMGSDNQRLHLLTERGRERFAEFDRPRMAADERLDVMFDDEGAVWMAGIPNRGDLERLRAALAASGTVLRTTEHQALVR